MDQTVAHPVHQLLREAADRRTTGCLVLLSPDGAEARVWLREGQVYAITVPGHRPKVGVRLLSSGVISPEQLAEALEVQRRELPDWRVGELLVHLGFVERHVVDAFVAEQVRDQVADLLRWEIASIDLHLDEEARYDIAPPVAVDDLLSEAEHRVRRWSEIAEVIGGAAAVPVLATTDTGPADVVLGPHDWALLSKVDGVRDVATLAQECGFTVAETGQLVQALLGAGLIVLSGSGVPTVEGPWGSALPPEPSWVGDDLDVGRMRAGLSGVLDALGELLRAPVPVTAAPQAPVEAEPAPIPLAPPVEAEPALPAPPVERWADAEWNQPPPPPREPVASEPPAPPVLPEPVATPASPREAALMLTELVNEPASGPAASSPPPPPPAEPQAPSPTVGPTQPAPPTTGPEVPADEQEHLDPADAAALLRELSSLGGDEPKPATPAAPPPRQTPPPSDKKKKRGFFGH